MSDVRARLVEALREHRDPLASPVADWRCEKCSLIALQEDHLADVLLSLPGIAIVDIEDIGPVAEALFSADRCGIHRCPRKAFGWENVDPKHQGVYRRMARVALAAANAADAVTQ